MISFKNKRRSFWKYLKDNGVWIPIAINVLVLVIAYMSWQHDIMSMVGLMVATLLALWIGDYITWKRHG